MIPFAIKLPLFVLTIGLAQFGAHQVDSQRASAPCESYQFLGKRKLDVSWVECPEKVQRTPDRFYVDHKFPITKNDKEKRRTRDFNICRFGSEYGRSCDANPDISPCDDGTYPIVRQLFREGDNSSPEQVIKNYQYCPNEPEPDLPNDVKVVEIIKVSNKQFRSFPIRASKLSSDPSKFSLKNGYTHFWASKDPQTFDIRMGDTPVKIKAFPVQWNWDYGDGNTKNFNVPGESSPNHTLHDETPTSHVYKETGKFKVVVTTLYRGEFSVDGGAWQSIPGQAAVPSDPVVMDVWRTQKQLIAFD